jgi:uncharacterized membrane protein
MRWARLLHHLLASPVVTRRHFSAQVRGAIEAAIREAESSHAGEICFAIETSLPWRELLHDVTPPQRAVEVFARLRVWDTQANNGVLIYVLWADRAVEIIADRGISQRVARAEWEALCREVEGHYRAGRFTEGSRAAVAGVATLLGRHFPSAPADANELPNQPILL